MKNCDKWTTGSVLTWAKDSFKNRDFNRPRLEAELLLAFALAVNRLSLYTNFDKPLSYKELKKFRELILRRRDGEPLAYITGKKEFMSLDFIVSPNVMIPRPETELLVETALALTINGPVLDLCTGSGCIAVAIAANNQKLTIDATDISKSACQIAKKNIERHNLADRVHIFTGDLFSMVSKKRYETICANPPYVSDSEYETLAPEVKREPQTSLTCPDDGFKIINRILKESKKYLFPGGNLIIEMDPCQTQMAAKTKGPELLGVKGTIKKDLSGRDRAVVFTLD